ncbi:MAG: 2-polyprenyl-6-hydroxyphenyl methylase/3-demethylubiquinone-9 3-methyltransferase [Bradyrhizobium sp.]
MQTTSQQLAAQKIVALKSKLLVLATSNFDPRHKKPRPGGVFFIERPFEVSAVQLRHITAIIQSMNADPQELKKFSDLAHRWWDPTSEFRPLHQINPLRLEWINARIPLANKAVLDIGCGGGILAESMARKGAKVTGIDLSEKALKVADLHSLEAGIEMRYEMISAENMAEREPATFDVVTCMEMLEHVPDPEAIVRACATLVKPGGKVFFSTLNRNPKSYLFAIIGAEYVLGLLPKGTHDYSKFITPSELSRYARVANLNVDGLKGMTYNPFLKSYSLNGNTDVNYMVACTRPIM